MYSLIGAITLFLILVTFHEYGHYSVARYFKIKILKMSSKSVAVDVPEDVIKVENIIRLSNEKWL